MSSLHWHSVLPPGAFDPSALAEDLSPTFEQAGYFGQKKILLAPESRDAGRFPVVMEGILRRALIPQRYIALDEFSLSDQVTEQISRGSHFAIAIDREPSAAAVERMISTMPQLSNLSYVVIGRKDWRFKDTFRSLPHFIRSRLFLDFPVSLHESDPFYSPAELAAILDELKTNCGLGDIRSFSPHFHLRRELLGANIIAVSGPAQAFATKPELSIVAPDPDVANQLASSKSLRELGHRVEVVVPRIIGRETKLLHSIQGVPVSHVWLHLEDPAGRFPEMEAHLRNWGARYALGKSILFADGETLGHLDRILDRLLAKGDSEKEILRSGLAVLVESEAFRGAGGFDPLYCYFGLGEAEFLHRYLNGLRPEAEDEALAKFLRERIRGSHAGVGLGLFYHQYFDHFFFRYFFPSSSSALPGEEGPEKGPPLRNHFRYRMEQSRDAYLSLYKASPKVALAGNIQLLLRPYHWIKPHAWRLKMPVYPLIVKPFHGIKLHAWKLRVPAYWIHRNSVQAFHRAKRHAWRLRAPVAVPYHFLRQHAWKLKLALHFLKSNVWRVKQIYHFLFWMFFPVRKVLYFCEYQYEKRVLGLYGRR